MAALPGVDVLEGIYVEADVAPGSRTLELELLEHLIKDEHTPFAGGVVHGDPASPDIEAWLARAAGVVGVHGVRAVLHTPDRPRGSCLLPPFIEGLRTIGEAGMHFELCMRGEELADAAALALAAPGTRLVLDHFGNPGPAPGGCANWKDDIALLAEQENVWCKVSGFFENAEPGWTLDQVRDLVDHVRSCFGVERLMFGGNWPVCTLLGSLQSWLDVVDEVTSHWSASDREALLHGNAATFYRVS